MRYIGSKDNLLDFIVSAVQEYCPDAKSVVDLFSGTAAVGRRLKTLGYDVLSNDIMSYAYAFSRTYIQNSEWPSLEGLVSDIPDLVFLPIEQRLACVLDMLNDLPGIAGFVSTHYCPDGPDGRMYLTPENACRIDAIRITLDTWRMSHRISDSEFYILLTSLLEAIPLVSNISGTYGAYLKYWERRALKPICLCPPQLLLQQGCHAALQEDANRLATCCSRDLFYLDPPYNGRQYAANYHLLETVAVWDHPRVRGITGLTERPGRDSLYCGRKAGKALSDLVSSARCKHIILSYNSEGLIPHDTICEIFSTRGSVHFREIPYRRFRSDSIRSDRKYKSDTVLERLYHVAVNG